MRREPFFFFGGGGWSVLTNGSSHPNFFLHIVGSIHRSMLIGKVASEIILCPAVTLLRCRGGNGESTVSANLDVRFAAV